MYVNKQRCVFTFIFSFAKYGSVGKSTGLHRPGISIWSCERGGAPVRPCLYLPLQLTEVVGQGAWGRGGQQEKKKKRSDRSRGLTCDAYITGHVTCVSQWEAAPAGTMQQVHRASSSLSVTTKTSVHPGTAVWADTREAGGHK